MSKNEILSSAMAEEEINKLIARKNDIAESITEKRAEFEKTDVETRDAILEDVDSLTKEADEIDSQISELEEVRAKFEEQEKRMSLTKTVAPEKVEERAKEQTVDKYDTPEYRKAWVDAIRTNDDTEFCKACQHLIENIHID